ncbi:unnamed protein product [Adineta ricciae]|uniref:NADAR domain-containing protein n=2 Tax=Adineta ricciae TaxID=249248 RepID=A0A815MQB3_ADIRI|nr:unnamed protein product [Adineta ricciae]
MTNPPIYFYRPYELFGELSNFYSAPIELDGTIWPTTEHYYQAQKFTWDKTHYENIRQLETPHEAFLYVREHDFSQRTDWEQVKDEVMFKACLAKFEQHSKLKEFLLSTGDRILIEHTGKDSYWGDGPDGKGRNQLGVTLMKIREYFSKSLQI